MSMVTPAADTVQAPARLLPADDPRHGTTRGHAAGCRCYGCRNARNTDEAKRRKYRQVLGVHRRIPAFGTQRRIRALMALGWTSREISTRCGWSSAEATTELTKARRFVFLTTAERIAKVYDELSMTPGPSAQNRRAALRKGWPPPLAWDDIDDPNEEPADWQYVPIDRAAALIEMDAHHIGISEACRVLQLRRDSLEKWCHRHDHAALYSRMVQREQPNYEALTTGWVAS